MPEPISHPTAAEAERPPSADAGRLPRRLSPTLRGRMGYLVAQAHIAMHAAAAEAMDGLGLTVKHYACLTMIGETDAISQAALVEQSQIDRSTMVAIVDDLEAAGYVERSRNPNDRRAYALRVTDAGREWLAETNAALDAMEDGVLAALSPAERERLLELLQRMLEG